ncbi:caspase family protein [Streptomyces sp. NPDC090045]|uniref:caspase, EACC1-associated type n=1 Tax=Streptomyces sp. NPDC090045 TaxID=3365927 RepID=UPI00381CC1BE
MTTEEGRSSRAVLFGVHEFRHFGDLTGVQHSLVALRDMLTDQDVCALPDESCETVPADAPPGQFLDALEDAAEAAEHLLVVYYAGHGHHGSDGSLLLATRASSVQRSYHSVRYETVREIVAGSRALHKVVIIDCCWSGLVHMDAESAGVTAFAVPGTCVLTSAAATEKSLCEPEGSVFTLALTTLLGEGLSGPLSDGALAEHLPRLAMDHIYDALCARLAGREVAGQKVPQPRMSALDAGHRISIARNRAYAGEPVQLETLHAEYERLAARRNRQGVRAVSPPSRPSPGHGAQCPYCLRYTAFDESRLLQPDEKGLRWIPVLLDEAMHPALRHSILQRSFHECPLVEHEGYEMLPAPYFLHDEPLTIALIGSSASGRTTLLAAMVSQIEDGLLEPLGLRCLPLSPPRHKGYTEGFLRPYREGRMLPMTGPSYRPGSVAGLLVTGGGRTRPVIFFDVDCGTLESIPSPDTDFLIGSTAFIFVLDPIYAFRGAALERERRPYSLKRSPRGDPFFNRVIGALPWQSGHAEAHATVAVTKSDLLSTDPTVRRWLSTGLELNSGEPGEESRDAYAYARHHGGVNWVKPFHHFSRCTLHFVSATGGSPSPGGDYKSRPTPQRVLAPLLSIFSAAGLLDTEDGRSDP